MATMTVESALDQCKRCRDDWRVQVRERRQQARAQLEACNATAATIKAADAEAIAFLQGVAADAATPPGLKQYINNNLAFHARAKADQAAEA